MTRYFLISQSDLSRLVFARDDAERESLAREMVGLKRVAVIVDAKEPEPGPREYTIPGLTLEFHPKPPRMFEGVIVPKEPA